MSDAKIFFRIGHIFYGTYSTYKYLPSIFIFDPHGRDIFKFTKNTVQITLICTVSLYISECTVAVDVAYERNSIVDVDIFIL